MRSSRRFWKNVVMIALAVLVILGTIKCGDDSKSFAPSIEDLRCPPERIETGTPAVLEWTASDPDGQIAGYYYGLDDDALETWTVANTCTLTNISVGAHVFFVQAEDNDNRRSQVAYCSFRVTDPVSECVVSPASLDFGTVPIGSRADLSFTITNDGSASLSGTISGELWDHYSILSGAGSYSLITGQSHTVKVRFEAASCGTHACAIETGNEACSVVTCTGEAGGTNCELSTSSLDFGAVDVGSSADMTLTLTNTGCTTLSGTIGELCDHYVVVSGNGTYSLGPAQVHTVLVRFSPESAGVHTCTLETGLTGTPCSLVHCTGQGREVSAACDVSPTSLDFGPVEAGTSADLSFTITNNGAVTLSGTVSESAEGDCDDFAIISGDGAYSLDSGQSITVTIRFSPTSCGVKACTIQTGNEGCLDVTCTGEGEETSCDISPAALDFGLVDVGASADRSFALTNTGCTTLSGTIGESCAGFSVASGGGPYSLGAGEVRTVTVRLSPSSAGIKTCTVETGLAGTPCSSIACEGEGRKTDCIVSPRNLNFGSVDLGSSSDLSFTITNNGSTTLSGAVTESCDHYSIVSGGGSYSLGVAQSHTVIIRFEPTSCGAHTCTVETGDEACLDVDCAGVGSDVGCSVSPSNLDFGVVETGSSDDRSFTITNNGCTTLSGTVSESCSEYSILSGGGSYSLLEGEEHTVTVRFTPDACGTRTCDIETGNEACSDVNCTAEGEEVDCVVSPANLGFGSVDVGSSKDLTFTIANSGCTTISGTVTESCDDFSIVSGDSHSIDPGESHSVIVRFSPNTVGLRTCTIDTGDEACQHVICSGTGEVTGCDVSPNILDFGSVDLGSGRDTTFTIINEGSSTLSGAIGESCDDFSIVSGGGPYSLALGESLRVSVRFEPTSCGAKACTIDTGDETCSDVACSGEGNLVGCDVSSTNLDFGTVDIGSSQDKTFTITNNGCDPIEGTMSESCDDYSIVSGDGTYSINGGESHVVTVRFEPISCGAKTCTVETGAAACMNVSCTGQGAGTECAVTPDVLSFGSMDIGSSADTTFTITNNGCGPLAGAVSESCDDYSIVSGGGVYSLAAGESLAVTIRFEPASCGMKICTIETGNAACSDVSCTGEGKFADCGVSLTDLDFGTVDVGSSQDTTFTITNNGCGPLAGAVSESCDDYSVVSGDGVYSLAEGESLAVTVRFEPMSCGAKTCTIETGNDACSDMSCTGQAGGAGCSVLPSILNFDLVELGSIRDRAFTITNNGCDPLTGTISEPCDDYSIISGGGAYSIDAGQSHIVTVRLGPTSCGTKTCTVETGNAACSNVSCTGEVFGTECEVSPGILSFGSVDLGSDRDLAFTITNSGCDPLEGTVSQSCDDYSIISGGGAYSLAAGEWLTVTVRFRPMTCGTKICTVETGNAACADVSCMGEGDLIACDVSPASVDLGSVDIGSSADTTFTITNNGCDPLTGTVSQSCDDYSIISGGGAYSLAAGEWLTVTVRFSPMACGTKLCTIETGNEACSDVSFTGEGDLIACDVSPTGLDFGSVDIGSSADTTFTITNNGCDPLAGTVSQSCDDYSIISGGGAYSINAGQSHVVTVRFSPTTCGTKLCAIETGDEACSDVSFTGEGDLIACDVSPTGVDFGSVDIGSSADTTFTITNNGCDPLAGTVSQSCDDYSIISGGGAYSINAGQSHVVTVRFSPTTCGTKLCAIETGNAACSDVSFTGEGDLIACDVSPASVDFGSVDIGSSADTTFTITNNGCDPLEGTVSQSCDDYSIISGDGAYSINAGQSHNVTVRFSPTACGTKTCAMETGNAACSDVSFTGEGMDHICGITPASIDFGSVTVGSSADTTITISNTGDCGTVSGTIAESCDEFEIVSGEGAFSLSPGQSIVVTLRFAPTSAGAKICTITTGSAHCSDVTCDGTGT